MNFQFYVEKLEDSEVAKKFLDENKDAFPCSCFFIIDKQGKDNKQHFDYFVPSKKKIFSFQTENGQIIPIETSDKNFDRISLEHDFDFDDIEDMIKKEMEKNNIKKDIQKILFSLQKLEGKDYLVGTVFVSNLGMLKVNIDLAENKITDFQKKSFFDMMNVFKKK